MSVFTYSNYREYLTDILKNQPNRGYGFKSKLAEAVQCQSTYISRVLKGQADLSLEQGEKTGSFLNLSDEEKFFFLLLIQRERSGNLGLKEIIDQEIEKIKSKNLFLKKRLDVKDELSEKDQMTYYSSWIYSAIHILATIPHYQKKATLFSSLRASKKLMNKALTFLNNSGLIETNGEKIKTGKSRIHLGNDSPMVVKHHQNWRLRAIEAIEQKRADDLHYSSVVSLSKEDAYKIKEIMIKSIKESKEIIKDSKEEVAYSLNLDFFKITE